MARYPDHPNNYSDDEPTAYSNYGDYGGHEPPGPPPEPEVPWYRNRRHSSRSVHSARRSWRW